MMTLDQAVAIIDGALALASAEKCKPLAVVVVDAAGNAVASKRQDGASFLRMDLAYGKARAAMGFGADTRELAVRAKDNPNFFVSAAAATGDVVLSPGGVLIFYNDAAIGAIGISGDTGDTDETCAQHGIVNAGLTYKGGSR